MNRADLAGELSARLTAVHGVHIVKRQNMGETVLHRFDPATRTLEIGSHLASGQYVFKLAAELGYLEFGDLIDKLVDEGKFTSDESRTLARLGLANYFAAAPCCRTSSSTPWPRSSATTSSGCRRTTRCPTRPSRTGCPPCSGRPCAACRCRSCASTGPGTCRNASPRPVFISRPRVAPAAVERVRDVRQPGQDPGADRPDARRPAVHVVARTVERRASRYGQPGKTFAIGLGCELRHAHRLVYSEGLELTGDPNVAAIPIGAGCRVCERDNCPPARVPPHSAAPSTSTSTAARCLLTW